MTLKIKAIATDLDGTMMHHQNEVSPGNYEAVMRAREKGCIYIVATGRCSRIIPRQNLPQFDYCLTCNGSYLLEEATGKVIYSNYVPADHARKALAIIRRYHPFLEIFVDDNIVLEKETDDNQDQYRIPLFHREYFKTRKHIVVNSYEEFLETDMASHITKINMPYPAASGSTENAPVSEEEWDELKKELEDLELFCTASDGMGIELTNIGVSKGNTLRLLLDYLGISREELVAFGDGANDEKMLEYAGYGVAMANAKDKAKAAAGYTTASNKEDGVARFLEEEFGI